MALTATRSAHGLASGLPNLRPRCQRAAAARGIARSGRQFRLALGARTNDLARLMEVDPRAHTSG